MRLLPQAVAVCAQRRVRVTRRYFLLTSASMGFSVYGPAILQTLRGYSALFAGYVIALEALAWTAAGLMVARLTGAWPTE